MSRVSRALPPADSSCEEIECSDRRKPRTRPVPPEATAADTAPARRRASGKLPAARTLTVARGDETFEFRDRLPLLPLRDVVIFPYMTIPLLVGRLPSINAIEKAVARDRMLFVTAQKSSEVADPTHEELYKVGTVVRVLQLFRLPDGTIRVLVEGVCRCKVERFAWSSDYYTVRVEVLEEDHHRGAEVEAQMRHVLSLFNDYVHLNRRIPDEVLMTANNITDPVSLAHNVAAHLLVKVPTKQRLLEVQGAADRLKLLAETLAAELEIVKLERKIEGQVRSQVHKNQKEFYLNEQLKAIRKELGHQNEFASELEELQAAIRKARMPREVATRAAKELERLARMSFMSPEATVVRNYLDWLVSLPWRISTRDSPGHRRGRARARRGSLRAAQGEGAHRRVPVGAQAHRQESRADPVLRRAARRGQDVARQVHRARPRPPLRARGARRRA